MKQVIAVLFFLLSYCVQAQSTQAQIDSIMTLYPNCMDYPPEVLVVLDSLLVALAMEEDDIENTNEASNDVDSLFYNYLSTEFPGLIVNDQIVAEQASLITDLNLDGLGLYSINGIELFTNLESLSCSNNNLTLLPPLPQQLQTADFRWNNLVSISLLPESLVQIDLRYNDINSVPPFPNQIEDLKICYNNLVTIPNLPDSLRILFCAYNNLIGLPALPSHIEQILCYNNQINSLEALPETLEVLRVQNNNLNEIPEIPFSMQTLVVTNNPIVCVNAYPIDFQSQLGEYSQCIYGCIDSVATNFNSLATSSNGSCSYGSQVEWPTNYYDISTGVNATYLIQNLLFNDSLISSGYTLGAFFRNEQGKLVCAGYREWSGGPESIAVYSDDDYTPEKDGFHEGDKIIWLARSTTDMSTSNIGSVEYMSGSDFFTTNSINLISDFVISDTIVVFGCTNPIATNFDNFASIDDGSCTFAYEQQINQLNDSIEQLQLMLDATIALLEQQFDTLDVQSQCMNLVEEWNISRELYEGWNMFGYGCPSSISLTDVMSSYQDQIIILKDYNGSAYLPEFQFNGIGDLTPGFGYQIKLSESIQEFRLCDWYIENMP